MNSPSKKKIGLIFIIITLISIGTFFLAIASQNDAKSTTGDQYYFIKKHLVWVFLGAISFLVGAKVKPTTLSKIAGPLYLFSTTLLLIVLIPQFGTSALGASRWINLGIVGIQPTEIFKLSTVIFFAKLFSHTKNKNIVQLLKYLSLPLFLILLEPNFSSVVLISAIVLTLYYLAEGDILPIFITSVIALLIGSVLVFSSPYRLARLTKGYHSEQMTLTLASGGLFGKGIANSDQKYSYLPKVSTDSILAVVGEETGFIGILIIISLYILLIINVFTIGQNGGNEFSQLVPQGIAVWIAYQSLINISATTGIIPITGVTLPLISYGGSSLVVVLFSLGLVQNFQSQTKLIYSTSNADKKNNRHYRQSPHSSHRTN